MADKKRQRIGLFGGTFDPVHNGHLMIAEWVQDSMELDKVVFIPNNIHPFRKRSDISESDHRLAMIKLAIEKYVHFEVSELELHRKGISYTIDTLKSYITTYPDASIYYIMGADNLSEFTSWKQPHEILKLAHLLVYNRPGIEIDDSLEHERMILLDSPFIDISSTHVRHRIQSGRAFRSLVPCSVFQYIVDHKLYMKEKENPE